MIITFITDGFSTINDDYSVTYDNCKEVRTKALQTPQEFKKAKKTLEDLQGQQGWRVKCWLMPAGCTEYDGDELLKKAFLISFESNGENYFILTATKTYIANDENKTFRVLN